MGFEPRASDYSGMFIDDSALAGSRVGLAVRSFRSARNYLKSQEFGPEALTGSSAPRPNLGARWLFLVQY